MGLLEEAAVPAWTQWRSPQGFLLSSDKTGPILLPSMQSDTVIEPLYRERGEADAHATPLE